MRTSAWPRPRARRNFRYPKPREFFVVNPEVVLPPDYEWMRVQTVLKRARGRRPDRVVRVSGPQVIVDILKGARDLDRERLYVFMLDGGNRALGAQLVSMGGTSGTVAVPADIFRGALLAGATGIVVVHNHPSGEPKPSTEDILVKRRLSEAARYVGVRLLDFMVIGEDGRFWSAAEEGQL